MKKGLTSRKEISSIPVLSSKGSKRTQAIRRKRAGLADMGGRMAGGRVRKSFQGERRQQKERERYETNYYHERKTDEIE